MDPNSRNASYQSVMDVLEAGTEAMQTGEVITVDTFTLQDAMSAVEIMDPRMDSGLTPSDTEGIQPFDPLMELLPQEICWILDKALACEMTWQVGYTLTQTVYTCLYVHHTRELGYDSANYDPSPSDDLRRVVLRAGIFGMLKCCDLAWRELSRGNVHDTEDWNSEKSDISLLEGTQLSGIVDMLDKAITWLEHSPQNVDLPWKDGLLIRLRLRKALLQIFYNSAQTLSANLQAAQHYLRQLTELPTPDIPANSRARSAFDRAITRTLPSFLPLPTIEILDHAQTLDSVRGLLTGREILFSVENTTSLMEWKMTSMLHCYKNIGVRSSFPSYIRSLGMSIFYYDDKIINQYPVNWAVDKFFTEFANLPPGALTKATDSTKRKLLTLLSPPPKQVEEFEGNMAKLIEHYFCSCFHSRSRQRREFANAIHQWQCAFAEASAVVDSLRGPANPNLLRIPFAIQYHRLDLVREVIFSGFELELYSSIEKPLLYWYAIGILRVQRVILEQLMDAPDGESSRPENSNSHLSYEHAHITVLMELSNAFARLCIRLNNRIVIGPPPKRQLLNTIRRFKWAFEQRSGNGDSDASDPAMPDFEGYEMWKDGVLLEDDWICEVGERLEVAQEILNSDVMNTLPSSFQLCRNERDKLTNDLRTMCNVYLDAIQSGNISRSSRLMWNHDYISWFPILENDHDRL